MHPSRRNFVSWLLAASVSGPMLVACLGVQPSVITPSTPTSLPTVVPDTPTQLTPSAPTPVGSAYAHVEMVIPVKGIPFGLAVSRGTLWILQRFEPFPSPGSVLPIDLVTGQIISAPIQLDFDPWSIAATEDAVWVAKNGPAALVHIDPQTKQIMATIEVDASLVAVDTHEVWVTGTDNTATHIDPLTSRSVGTPVPTGIEPIQLVAGAGSVWVGSHGSGTVTRIDSQTGRALATIDVGFPVHGLGAGPNSVWAADYHGYKVVQISSLTNQIVGEPIPLSFPPYAVAVSASEAWVGVSAIDEAEALDDRVVRIDARTNTIVDTLHVGGPSFAIMLDDEGALWVATDKPSRIVKLVPQPLPTPTPQ